MVIDAASFLSHLSQDRFPSESLAAAVYLQGGVRSVGLGGLAFGERDSDTAPLRAAPWEYLRLAIPRRVYTDNHLAYVAEVVREVWAKPEEIDRLRAVEIPEHLPHFTAVFAPAPP